jgi:hypothetical protein
MRDAQGAKRSQMFVWPMFADSKHERAYSETQGREGKGETCSLYAR